jgi:hypothetical protein
VQMGIGLLFPEPYIDMEVVMGSDRFKLTGLNLGIKFINALLLTKQVTAGPSYPLNSTSYFAFSVQANTTPGSLSHTLIRIPQPRLN